MTIRSLLLATTLAAGGTAAAHAQATAIYDPAQLPMIRGTVSQYSLTPRGDVDGAILQDGTQIHLPPHLGAQVVGSIRPGDAVTVRGLKARAIPVVQAFTVTDDRTGRSVADDGPPGNLPQPLVAKVQWLSVDGRVREPLYGPGGDLDGALLDDGTQVHLPPDRAQVFAQDLQAGQTLSAQGYGVAGAYGRSLDAQTLGRSAAQLAPVAPAAPPPGGPGAVPPGGPSGVVPFPPTGP